MRTRIHSVILIATAGLACNGARAMAPRPIPAPQPVVVAEGDHQKGHQLGLRNGGLIVERLRQRTVGAQGCAGVADLESALVQVTRSIRPPAQSAGATVSGFYRGYLDAVHQGVRDVRESCGTLAHETGLFAGSLLSAVACQVVAVDAQALSLLEVTSLYEGWSGGAAEVVSSCVASVQATLTACAGPEPVAEIELIATAGCED